MLTRREAVLRLGSASIGARIALAQAGVDPSRPPLARGAATSPERMALIDAFRQQSDGIEKRFEARAHKSDLAMPYRLFRPEAAGKLEEAKSGRGAGRRLGLDETVHNILDVPCP